MLQAVSLGQVLGTHGHDAGGPTPKCQAHGQACHVPHRFVLAEDFQGTVNVLPVGTESPAVLRTIAGEQGDEGDPRLCAQDHILLYARAVWAGRTEPPH